MAILPILHYPHDILLTGSDDVTAITPDLERLVQDMIETMHAAPGVGLAANQIGVTRRVAVVDLTCGEDPESVQAGPQFSFDCLDSGTECSVDDLIESSPDGWIVVSPFRAKHVEPALQSRDLGGQL